MERHIKKIARRLEVFLRGCRDLMIYIPYEGVDLVEFLGSCFHRQFRAILKEQGSRETALFTENRRQGRLFLFLSCRNIDFDSSNARALLQAGILSGESSQTGMEMWSCYVFKSNSSLGQENFYSPSRIGKGVSSAAMGAEWLLACLATQDRLYDCHLERFEEKPIRHECYNHAWCEGLHSVFSTDMPDWLTLFPPPWNQSHPELQGFYPYRIRKINLSEMSQGEKWREAVYDDLRPSLFSTKDLDGGFTFDRAKVSSSHSHISEGSASTSCNEACPAGPKLAVREVPTSAKSKPDLSSKLFAIHSDYLTKHLSPWTIGSYQSENENLTMYKSKSNAMANLKVESPWANPSVRKSFGITESHGQDAGVSRPPRVDLGSPFPPFQNYDRALSLGVGLADGADGHETMSDSDDPAWIFLNKAENETDSMNRTGAAEDLNDSGVSHKHVSESRKAKKKAYHQRRRQQKAASTEIGNTDTSDGKSL